MKLYDNAPPSTYDEIKTWYPVWYRDILEMDALWRVWGDRLDEIQAGIIQAIDNNYIDYADEATLAKWETFFNVTYDGPRTVAERKNLLKALLLGAGHIGQQEIKDIISVFTNGTIDVQLIGGMVQITVTRNFDENFNLYDCHYILDNKIPAHLALDMIDKLLPVSVFTDNQFILRDLKLKLSVQNRKLSSKGVLLNGANNLDGTWLLDSTWQGILFPDFHVTAILPKNTGAYTPQAVAFSEYKLQNRFDLAESLSAALRIENSEAINLVNTGIKSVFRNHGVQLQGIGLNGRFKLDSSWNLDAEKDEIFAGIIPHNLKMAGLSMRNTFEASARLQFAANAETHGNLRQGPVIVYGLGAKQPFGLSGSVFMDGLWNLNGDFILNGSKSLNQIFKEEAL